MPSKIEFIGEIGVNHNGDLGLARELVYAIAESGASTVKLQLFRPEALVTKKTRLAAYQVKNGVNAVSQAEMLEALILKPTDVLELNRLAVDVGVDLLVTPFDFQSMLFVVEQMGHTRVKFSSGDLTFQRLIFETAKKGVHLILSTGMSTIREVEAALEIARAGFAVNKSILEADFLPSSENLIQKSHVLSALTFSELPITLLHCTSTYPAPISELNISALESLTRFGLPVGYSDHSSGTTGAILALAFGAKVFEKHVTISKDLDGPDHAASLTPVEFQTYIREITQAKIALGSGEKIPQVSEMDVKEVARRGLYSTQALKRGDKITSEMIVALRPESAILADREFDLVGQVLSEDLEAGDGFV